MPQLLPVPFSSIAVRTAFTLGAMSEVLLKTTTANQALNLKTCNMDPVADNVLVYVVSYPFILSA